MLTVRKQELRLALLSLIQYIGIFDPRGGEGAYCKRHSSPKAEGLWR